MKKYNYGNIIKGLLILSSVILFLWGSRTENYDLWVVAVLMAWGAAIFFTAQKIKERILFFFFLLAFYLFLMGHPVLSFCQGKNWWGRYDFTAELFAFRAVYISLLALYAGAEIYSALSAKMKIRNTMKESRLTHFENENRSYIRIVAAIGGLVSWLCGMVTGVEKMTRMAGRSYVEYYQGMESNIPYIFHVCAGMLPYLVCVFLATNPKKKWGFTALLMLIISTLPMLRVGVRNQIVLYCIFSFLYYFIRDAQQDEEKWIGKFEKALMILGIPAMIFFMSIYLYIRVGGEIKGLSLGKVLEDFIFGQGVTFLVLARGYMAIPSLPVRPWRNYTFGGFIDYITHGSLAVKFFGAKEFVFGNNLPNALESNNLSYNLSYIAVGEERYLIGDGVGSSFILETYIDYGYPGMIIYSLIMGALLIAALKLYRKNILCKTIILVMMTSVFFVPRAEATGFIEFLLYARFWIVIVGVYVGAVVLKRIVNSIWMRNGRKK